jgi:Peptidase family M28
MRKRLALALFVAAGVAATAAGAADTTAWFGTPGPAPLSDVRKPVMKYDDAFPPLPAEFKSRPGKSDELLSGAALKADQKKIVAFSLESLNAGDKVWGRRAATPAFMHTLEWVANEFKTAGLKDAKVEPFGVTAPMWVPISWQLQLIADPAFGAGTQTVTLQSAFPQPGGASIPGGTLTAPVVYVGHGTDADLAGRDLKGKIAIVRVRPEPSLFGAGEQGVAAKLVEKNSAAGVINAIEGPGNAQYIDPRFACGKAPCFMIGGQDAWFLQTVIGKAANAGTLDKMKVAMSLTSKEETGLTSGNAIATIPGESATRIIINAHADGYFQGGDDNASGLAVLIGLAKYFAKQQTPKHTLMFVASGGHHGPGNGPGALVAAHPELKTGTLLILNLEHVAYADVVRGKVRAADNIGMTWETSVTESAKAVGVTNQSPFLFDLWKQASRCFGVATYQSAGTTVSGDLGGYRPIEAPMTQMIQSGTFYHSSGDVYEEVPAEGIERAARFHAFLIEQVDKAPESLIAAGKGTPYTPAIGACR